MRLVAYWVYVDSVWVLFVDRKWLGAVGAVVLDLAVLDEPFEACSSPCVILCVHEI